MSTILCGRTWWGCYDITMFALLLLSEWKKPDIYKQYVAELAAALSADNARLCGALSEARLELAENRQKCLEKQCEKLDFPTPPAETSAKAVWEVQLKVLFPITEQFRQQFTGATEARSSGFCPPGGLRRGVRRAGHSGAGHVKGICATWGNWPWRARI